MAKKSIEAQTEKILKEHNLDFTIEKEPLIGANTGRKTPYFGLFNKKHCINSVKDGYTISQNAEILSLVLEGTEIFGDSLRVSKAGSIKNGSKVYIQLEISGQAKVGQATIKRYVTIIDSNDGTTGLSVGIGDVDMFCENQFHRFYKKGQSKFRHTASITDRIAELPTLVEYALQQSLQLVKHYQTFNSTKLTKELAEGLIKSVMNYDKQMSMAEIREELANHKNHGRGLRNLESLEACIAREVNDRGNTLWAAHSGVTRWTTHEKTGPKRDNGKIESLMVGSGYKLNQLSYEYCVNAAGILVPAGELVGVN